MDDIFASLNAIDKPAGIREGFKRAPFPYPGGKFRSLESILPHLPYRSSFIDVFGGSATITLARHESPLEIFNDRHSGVTGFYRCLSNPEMYHQLLERLEYCVHSREEYSWCRDTWEKCQDPIERAARWWYGVTASFSSLNRNFGRVLKAPNQISRKLKTSLKLFHAAHLRMRHVTIENLDWRQCLSDYDSKDTVFYLDPTYIECCTGIYKDELTKADHQEMLDRVFHLEGFVAMSSYDNPIYNAKPWDNKYTWQVSVTMLSQAFNDENGLIGFEDSIKRGYAQECLYVKEGKE